MIPENEGANHAFLCARQASPNSKIRANLTLFRCNDGCAAHEIACICCHSEWHLNLGFFQPPIQALVNRLCTAERLPQNAVEIAFLQTGRHRKLSMGAPR